MQVLSVAGDGLEKLDRDTGIAVARDINDMLANAVKSHPDRFAAFAVLPLQAPDAGPLKLERCVTKVGFKGALISGTINGRFLDNPVFQPVFAAAESWTSLFTCTRLHRRRQCTKLISATFRPLSPILYRLRPGAGISEPECTLSAWWCPGYSTVSRSCKSSSAIWAKTFRFRWFVPTTA